MKITEMDYVTALFALCGKLIQPKQHKEKKEKRIPAVYGGSRSDTYITVIAYLGSIGERRSHYLRKSQ